MHERLMKLKSDPSKTKPIPFASSITNPIPTKIDLVSAKIDLVPLLYRCAIFVTVPLLNEQQRWRGRKVVGNMKHQTKREW